MRLRKHRRKGLHAYPMQARATYANTGVALNRLRRAIARTLSMFARVIARFVSLCKCNRNS